MINCKCGYRYNYDENDISKNNKICSNYLRSYFIVLIEYESIISSELMQNSIISIIAALTRYPIKFNSIV